MGSNGLLQTLPDSGLTGALAFGSCICVSVEQPKHSNKPINESSNAQCMLAAAAALARSLARSGPRADETHARPRRPTSVTITSVLLQDIFYSALQLKVFLSAAGMSEDERAGERSALI